MKFTLSWLKDHLTTDASLDEIIDKLTLIGLEVEDVQNPAESLKDFVVGEVLTAEQHPDADRLKQAYQEQMDAAKAFVVSHKILTLPPGEEVITVDTPPAQRRSVDWPTRSCYHVAQSGQRHR